MANLFKPELINNFLIKLYLLVLKKIKNDCRRADLWETLLSTSVIMSSFFVRHKLFLRLIYHLYHTCNIWKVYKIIKKVLNDKWFSRSYFLLLHCLGYATNYILFYRFSICSSQNPKLVDSWRKKYWKLFKWRNICLF